LPLGVAFGAGFGLSVIVTLVQENATSRSVEIRIIFFII
jgi:hypothetical protein